MIDSKSMEGEREIMQMVVIAIASKEEAGHNLEGIRDSPDIDNTLVMRWEQSNEVKVSISLTTQVCVSLEIKIIFTQTLLVWFSGLVFFGGGVGEHSAVVPGSVFRNPS